MRILTETSHRGRAARGAIFLAACALGISLSALAVATRPAVPTTTTGAGWIYYPSPAGLSDVEITTEPAAHDPTTGQCANGGAAPARVWQPGQHPVMVEIAFNPTLCEIRWMSGVLGSP